MGISKRKRFAIIGSGISGLSAAWLLDQAHDVVIYEAGDYLGGHTNTIDIEVENKTIAVDTGFIVYNEANYPNLIKFFEALGVKTAISDMSFAASFGSGKFEYSGSGLKGILGQKRNVFRPSFYKMVLDILRFYKIAPDAIKDQSNAKISLGEFLNKNAFSEDFTQKHLLPMGGAIWSTTNSEMRNYPLIAFLKFFENHGLLATRNHPIWRTVVGGSREYVRKIAANFKGQIRIGCAAQSVERANEKVYVTDINGQIDEFTDVVFACHAPEVLKLIEPTVLEAKILSAFEYTKNTAFLHSDIAFMPKRKNIWSSWNYIGESEQDNKQLCLSYWMNKLQPLDTEVPIIVTLNPRKPISEEKIFAKIEYEHPLFNQNAITAQTKLWQMQGVNNSWFCGAYFGYGFHEDGLQSGLLAAEMAGGLIRPWEFDFTKSRLQLPSKEVHYAT